MRRVNIVCPEIQNAPIMMVPVAEVDDADVMVLSLHDLNKLGSIALAHSLKTTDGIISLEEARRWAAG